jgi:signal transduction histidine kinase
LARRNLIPIEKAHEAQSRFTSDASHELRTPLAVMKIELEAALRDKNASTDELKEVLSSNLEEVNKLSKLAEMLLNLSRSDHTKLKIESVNLTKITKNVVRDFKLPTSRISLTAISHLTVKGDETALSELVKVLIDNALQYSPKGSQVLINLSKQDNQAKFEITNTGPGISQDKLPHIFERFFRADSSRTNGEHKGYGLGLALAKSIVELHNGELMASSTPDVETTFTFLLSLKSKPQAKSQN